MNTNEFNGLAEIKVGMGSSFNSFQLSKEEEQVIEKLNQIAIQNGFETSWSLIDTISPIDALHYEWPVMAKWMSNGVHDLKVELPNKKLSGLELWEYADKLYKLIGDVDHRFIESFELKGDTIEVFFGS